MPGRFRLPGHHPVRRARLSRYLRDESYADWMVSGSGCQTGQTGSSPVAAGAATATRPRPADRCRTAGRRVAVALATATLCTASLALAGCRGDGSPSARPPSGTPASSPAQPSAGPAETRQATADLSRAVRKLDSTSFEFDGGSGIARVSGAYDPGRRTGRIDGSFGIGAMDAVLVGPSLYVQGVDKDPNVWVRIRTDRLAPGNVLAQAIDPTIDTGYLRAIDSAAETSPGRYRGTIDPDRLKSGQLTALLGPAPRRVTFEAGLDRAGRLVELTVSVQRAGTAVQTTVTTRYHDFGHPVRVSPPPADHVREAPQQLYTVLAPNPSPSASASATPAAG